MALQLSARPAPAEPLEQVLRALQQQRADLNILNQQFFPVPISSSAPPAAALPAPRSPVRSPSTMPDLVSALEAQRVMLTYLNQKFFPKPISYGAGQRRIRL